MDNTDGSETVIWSEYEMYDVVAVRNHDLAILYSLGGFYARGRRRCAYVCTTYNVHITVTKDVLLETRKRAQSMHPESELTAVESPKR